MEIILAISTILGGVSAILYFCDKWREKQSIIKAMTKNPLKALLEIEHQGKIYMVPIERHCVLNNGTMKYIWQSPFETASGFPVADKRLSTVKSSLLRGLRKNKFPGQLNRLIEEETISIKKNESVERAETTGLEQGGVLNSGQERINK